MIVERKRRGQPGGGGGGDKMGDDRRLPFGADVELHDLRHVFGVGLRVEGGSRSGGGRTHAAAAARPTAASSADSGATQPTIPPCAVIIASVDALNAAK